MKKILAIVGLALATTLPLQSHASNADWCEKAFVSTNGMELNFSQAPNVESVSYAEAYLALYNEAGSAKQLAANIADCYGLDKPTKWNTSRNTADYWQWVFPSEAERLANAAGQHKENAVSYGVSTEVASDEPVDRYADAYKLLDDVKSDFGIMTRDELEYQILDKADYLKPGDERMNFRKAAQEVLLAKEAYDIKVLYVELIEKIEYAQSHPDEFYPEDLYAQVFNKMRQLTDETQRADIGERLSEMVADLTSYQNFKYQAEQDLKAEYLEEVLKPYIYESVMDKNIGYLNTVHQARSINMAKFVGMLDAAGLQVDIDKSFLGNEVTLTVTNDYNESDIFVFKKGDKDLFGLIDMNGQTGIINNSMLLNQTIQQLKSKLVRQPTKEEISQRAWQMTIDS
ncbi:hypothetical protein GR7B_00054 [Vibrio phage vB_VcorM_GR7B]|nr:hypothetical protein GR7B_00054 [Vibrio phage vB_VcorM_GR7B]